ncbi:hypothetical protein Glove_402g60 [Diversispora epigaea]|uniref:Uncharacterized protein n=1 Tax=Diversispora epigaea TaxID=1348612 RepID=A0A397GZR5_9GLOM|nr:hypothetical protein Glove_402g60 [Diversispora epigaea]
MRLCSQYSNTLHVRIVAPQDSPSSSNFTVQNVQTSAAEDTVGFQIQYVMGTLSRLRKTNLGVSDKITFLDYYLERKSDKNQTVKKLEKRIIDNIDKTIIKAFVMCNIPFNIIENSWFINIIKSLQPTYDSPSHHTLSSTLLQSELARISVLTMNELEKKIILQ